MTDSITKEKSAVTIKIKVGEWKYITSEAFFASYKNEPLLWNSVDTSIVQINPNSGLLYACDVGTTTVFATDANEREIKALCSIEVEATDAYLKSKVSLAQSTSTLATRCYGGYGEVSALGYSGTAFAYKIAGNRITLEKGLGAKNGTSNRYSELFRYQLIEMNNIYSAMSPTQKKVWLALRLKNSLDVLIKFFTKDLDELAEDYINDFVMEQGIDLEGMVESTVMGLRNWHIAEEKAIAYYKSF